MLYNYFPDYGIQTLLSDCINVIFIITGCSWYFICPWVTAGWAWRAWHQYRKVYPMRKWSFKTVTFSCHGYITQNIAYSLCPTKQPSLSFWSSNACKLALSCLESLVLVNQLQKRKQDHFVTLLMLVTLLIHALFKLLVVGLSRLSIWHLRYRFTTQKCVLIHKAVFLSNSDWGRQKKASHEYLETIDFSDWNDWSYSYANFCIQHDALVLLVVERHFKKEQNYLTEEYCDQVLQLYSPTLAFTHLGTPICLCWLTSNVCHVLALQGIPVTQQVRGVQLLTSLCDIFYVSEWAV